MDRKYDATVAGHICLDIIPTIPDTGIKEMGELFRPGKLIIVGGAKLSTGGPVSNTGIALKKLGLNVAFMTRVGNDYFGKLVTALLKAQGSAAGVTMSDQDRTSYTIAITPPGIDRMFLHDPGANDHFSAADLNEQIIRQSRLFHFGYPPIMAKCYQDEGAELIEIFRIARMAGAITSLDMALPDPDSASGRSPWLKILEKVLPYVDIFLPSIEEAFFMLDREKYGQTRIEAGARDMIDVIRPGDYSRLARQCLEFGSQIVVFKAAHRGLYIQTGNLSNDRKPVKDPINWSNRELWCPAFRVDKIASATGSGDAAIAGFLAAFLRNHSIEDTLKYANCVGCQNLHELDAISGIKSWQQTVAMIEADKLALIDIPPGAPEWNWNPDFKLWTGARDKKRTK